MPNKYVVIRDTKEKEGHGWFFTHSTPWCNGTKPLHLDTGDYTFEGHEKLFTIERKADTAEISLNIFEPRFVRELERMEEEIEHPFVVCEFSYQDVLDFPKNSGIPPYRWNHLKISNNTMLKAITEFQVKYKAKWILAGKDNGKRVASCIMKRMTEIIENAEPSKPRRNKK
jgi:ERCC4-type nuclease